jgi:hypothetical protein
MKKSLFTLASLALAIALAFAFVACEQPVEEDAGAGAAAVLRLYIDRPDGLTLDFHNDTADLRDMLEIRAGEEVFVSPVGALTGVAAEGVKNYPYPIVIKPSTNGILVPVNKSVGDSDPASGKAVDGKIWKAWSAPTVTGTESGNKNNPASYVGVEVDDVTTYVPNNKDRTKVIMIPPFRSAIEGGKITQPADFAYPGLTTAEKSPDETANAEPGSVIQSNNPKMKFLYSGTIILRDTAVGSTSVGSPVAYDATKGAYYVDIELVDKTPASKGYDDMFKGSGSFYLELRVSKYVASADWTSADQPNGGMKPFYYMYTPGKKGFNDFQGMTTGGIAVYKTDNANIKKFSLKPGINEIKLSDFSYTGQHKVDAKDW